MTQQAGGRGRHGRRRGRVIEQEGRAECTAAGASRSNVTSVPGSSLSVSAAGTATIARPTAVVADSGPQCVARMVGRSRARAIRTVRGIAARLRRSGPGARALRGFPPPVRSSSRARTVRPSAGARVPHLVGRLVEQGPHHRQLPLRKIETATEAGLGEGDPGTAVFGHRAQAGPRVGRRLGREPSDQHATALTQLATHPWAGAGHRLVRHPPGQSGLRPAISPPCADGDRIRGAGGSVICAPFVQRGLGHGAVASVLRASVGCDDPLTHGKRSPRHGAWNPLQHSADDFIPVVHPRLEAGECTVGHVPHAVTALLGGRAIGGAESGRHDRRARREGLRRSGADGDGEPRRGRDDQTASAPPGVGPVALPPGACLIGPPRHKAAVVIRASKPKR